MRILGLSLTNIGPFNEARIEFLRDADERPAVTLITGENGTGKSIVLDAIRGLFGVQFAVPEREIWRDGVDASMALKHSISTNDEAALHIDMISKWPGATTVASHIASIYDLPRLVSSGAMSPPPWVVEFWRSQQSSDSYSISALAKVDHRALYVGALQGTTTNAQITEWLCHFDYLRDSEDPQEQAIGRAVFEAARKIINWSLLDGEFVSVQRSTLTPRVRQAGHIVPLQNLSSGNAYLIKRMISLLGRMYSLHILRGGDPAELCNASGLLLIDEAENHLHPIWQKRFIPGIRAMFPNIQIIATTHSPFILASVPEARVYVCRYDHERATCTITEETDAYSTKPVEEILASAAFDGTQPFGERITTLLTERKRAIGANDVVARERIEHELVELNPTYFAFLEMDRELEALRRAG